MKFLVTGFPRTRTAWLSALLTAHCGELVRHERMPDEEIGDRRCDPCAIAQYWSQAFDAFKDSPIVFLHREPAESREALQAWCGFAFDTIAYRRTLLRVIENLERWRANAFIYEAHYMALDSYEGCNSVVEFLTGKTLDPELYRAFDLLKIEEHFTKAKTAWNHASTALREERRRKTQPTTENDNV